MVDIVGVAFLGILVGGTILFLRYLNKQGLLQIRMPFQKEKKTLEVPTKWVKEKTTRQLPETPRVKMEYKKPFKFRVPHLLLIKRILAAVLFAFYVFSTQASLLTGGITSGFYLLFLATAFILFDYIWKTRREKPPEWKVVEETG